MNELQKKLYQLLTEIDEICNRNQIVYYLAAGGALGAVRNGGFLPWDDDLDLYVTRNNWEKLRSVIYAELPDNRDFVCEEDTALYFNPVGRYVNRETTLMMKSQLLCGRCCGVMIEFFILDPMPVDSRENWKHRQYMKVYTELLTPYFVLNKYYTQDNKDFDIRLYNRFYLKSRLTGRRRVLRQLKEKITSFPEQDCREYCICWGGRTIVIEKEMIGSARLEVFEGKQFPILELIEKTFRIGYGDDWMYVPERDAQESHDSSKDLNRPFQRYVDLYRPLLDQRNLLKSYEKIKQKTVRAIGLRTAYQRQFTRAKAEIAAKHIRRQSDLTMLHRLLEENHLDALAEHLTYFFEMQFEDDIKRERISIPVSDKYLYIAAMYQILKGCYYKADLIIALREETAEPIGDELTEVKDMIHICRAFSEAVYDDKDVDKVQVLLTEYAGCERRLIDYSLAKLWALKQQADCDEAYRFLVHTARDCIDRFGRNGELISYEAYGLYRLGFADEAQKQYAEAASRTRNGFVWKEAKELFGIDMYDDAG